MNPVQAVGRSTLGLLRTAGSVAIFAGRGVGASLSTPWFAGQLARQVVAIGYLSLPVVGLTAGGTLAFYVYTTYMQKFLKLSVGLTDAQTTAVSAGSLLFAMILQPIYGALSDIVGRRALLIGFGVLGTLLTVPLLTAIRHASGPWQAFGLIAAAWAIVSGYTAINAVVKAELFPAAVRATGVAVPYAVAVSLFGGTAE